MSLVRPSPCKVNLLLNILGRRPDGFHELETVLQPVPLFDELQFHRVSAGIHLTCNDPALPVGPENLVYRAALAFFSAADIKPGVSIHLEKRIPTAAGLGGGSANAATTLLGLNELFGRPLDADWLVRVATPLGSDVPFFLVNRPALGMGRGERVEALDPFAALRGTAMLLIHPGFGVATPWAYRELGRYPEAVNGQPGRAARLIQKLNGEDLADAGQEFYNALEAPVLPKYPILVLFQEFLREHGAVATLMSGSGSTTFALTRGVAAAESLRERFLAKFGPNNWTSAVAL